MPEEDKKSFVYNDQQQELLKLSFEFIYTKYTAKKLTQTGSLQWQTKTKLRRIFNWNLIQLQRMYPWNRRENQIPILTSDWSGGWAVLADVCAPFHCSCFFFCHCSNFLSFGIRCMVDTVCIVYVWVRGEEGRVGGAIPTKLEGYGWTCSPIPINVGPKTRRPSVSRTRIFSCSTRLCLPRTRSMSRIHFVDYQIILIAIT